MGLKKETTRGFGGDGTEAGIEEVDVRQRSDKMIEASMLQT